MQGRINPAGRLWIVTGAEGFLGNNLVRELLARGERVRALTRHPRPEPSLAGLDCEVVPAAITLETALVPAFTTPPGVRSIVVHCAGIVSIASHVSKAVSLVNVEGTRNVIGACERTGVSRLIYVSSVHAIAEPDPPGPITEVNDPEGFDPDAVTGEYAKTKAAATAMVLAAEHLDCVVVHPGGLIGPYDFAEATRHGSSATPPAVSSPPSSKVATTSSMPATSPRPSSPQRSRRRRAAPTCSTAGTHP